MKKIFIITFLFLLLFFILFILLNYKKNNDTNVSPEKELPIISPEEDIPPLVKEEKPKLRLQDSCDMIASSSICVEYIGTKWKEKDGKLNCEGTGTFSEYACPPSDFGGCQANKGTVSETIAWFYEKGEGAYNDESIARTKISCEENPKADWIVVDDVK